MKTLNFITLKTQTGETITEAGTGRELNTISLILAALNNVKYRTREDQRKADRIYEKIEKFEGNVELEDAEFELVYSYVKDFEPYLSGRTFTPFLDELDRAAK